MNKNINVNLKNSEALNEKYIPTDLPELHSQVTNITELYDGFYVVEFLNGSKDRYAYYLFKEHYQMLSIFSVPADQRCDNDHLQYLYLDGFYDDWIKRFFF